MSLQETRRWRSLWRHPQWRRRHARKRRTEDERCPSRCGQKTRQTWQYPTWAGESRPDWPTEESLLGRRRALLEWWSGPPMLLRLEARGARTRKWPTRRPGPHLDKSSPRIVERRPGRSVVLFVFVFLLGPRIGGKWVCWS
jgi:hypothetical protein